jgi:hypothetical protein
MYSSMAYKNVATPNGFVVRIRGGISSGHPATSIIGSIVNWIVWSTIICKFYNWDTSTIRESRIYCAGDDTRGRLPWFVRNNNFDRIVELSGLICGGIEDLLGFMVTKTQSESVKFLKQVINIDGMPGWSRHEAFYNLFTTTRSPPRAYIERALSILGYLHASPFDHKLLKFIRELYLYYIAKSVVQDLTNFGRLTRPNKQLSPVAGFDLSISIARRNMIIGHNPMINSRAVDSDWDIINPRSSLFSSQYIGERDYSGIINNIISD